MPTQHLDVASWAMTLEAMVRGCYKDELSGAVVGCLRAVGERRRPPGGAGKGLEVMRTVNLERDGAVHVAWYAQEVV